MSHIRMSHKEPELDHIRQPIQLFRSMGHWVSAILVLSGAMAHGTPWHHAVYFAQWSNSEQNLSSTLSSCKAVDRPEINPNSVIRIEKIVNVVAHIYCSMWCFRIDSIHLERMLVKLIGSSFM